MAEALALLQRELLDEAEVDGLLRLVGEVAGEEDVGDVRLHELDRGRHAPSRARVGAGLAEVTHPGREGGVAHRPTVGTRLAERQSGAETAEPRARSPGARSADHARAAC